MESDEYDSEAEDYYNEHCGESDDEDDHDDDSDYEDQHRACTPQSPARKRPTKAAVMSVLEVRDGLPASPRFGLLFALVDRNRAYVPWLA